MKFHWIALKEFNGDSALKSIWEDSMESIRLRGAPDREDPIEDQG